MAKPVLYDLPVSNNGARCRIMYLPVQNADQFPSQMRVRSMCLHTGTAVGPRFTSLYFAISIYKKGIEDKVDIKSPKELGGLVSPEYRALNPQGKMPLLVCDDVSLPESDPISRHLLALFPEGESFVPSSLAARAKADLISRLHDCYIQPIQVHLYQPARSAQRPAPSTQQPAPRPPTAAPVAPGSASAPSLSAPSHGRAASTSRTLRSECSPRAQTPSRSSAGSLQS